MNVSAPFAHGEQPWARLSTKARRITVQCSQQENNMPSEDPRLAPVRGGVQAADTALSILETVAFSSEPLGVTQIAAALGTAKGATFRYLQTLLDRGYLIQDPLNSRFRLGLKAFALGRNAPAEWDLAALLTTPMRQLRDATGLSVVLST